MNERDDMQMLDQYLDGLLDAEQRQAFERRLAVDPNLAAAVEQQRQIDAAICRANPIPSPDVVLRRLPLEPRRRVVSPWRQRFTAMAAMIALAFGVKLIWSNYGPASHAPITPPTLDEVYHAQVASGFRPYWTCDNDQQFADTFRTRLGQPLLAHAPANAVTWGLAYAPVISSRSILVLAECDGTRSIVVVDRSDRDSHPRRSASSGLNVYRRTLGELVLYEITPSATAVYLEHFTIPADAAATKPRFPIIDSQSNE